MSNGVGAGWQDGQAVAVSNLDVVQISRQAMQLAAARKYDETAMKLTQKRKP
ncbi:hypothetical protein [Janthinobacterium sp. LM6]|uniref:hypothetical protein n=1 Tax=Janthinobacterium sp. LM6 TaxID=1938606 RepID=UPI0015C547E4|nr:hypothetical protein [Janthinobacterium sp. LM6]